MSLPKPPAQPSCNPDTADLFDMEWTYGMALAICQDCPVRDWCLTVVDPARNYYDGVAGGAVWKEGVPRQEWTNPRRDPVVVTYLARIGQLMKLNKPTTKKDK